MIHKLPHYFKEDGGYYYLAVNRTSNGTWSAGYIDFEDYALLDKLYVNDCKTLGEVYVLLNNKVERHKGD